MFTILNYKESGHCAGTCDHVHNLIFGQKSVDKIFNHVVIEMSEA